ncbi:acyl-CoA dehydrogenase [Microtetraspora sp. NBRC 13810]|uniref:acyl-CoA dehydrogenase family protein n=1 Tax=Microtetraspora sp. NBRC 13810 TaxID=3030990 RepID=UPI0024A5FAD3|nr:acyl-CoA dehydrogenase family protein [Microtetraspora sp. NBRC 13810]GLW12319.1 acyl-CoA dehydrogenase [Microtetraspora sp. NBRC 13810]
MTDLLYTQVEEELRAAVRDVLADRCPPAAVLGRIETASPYDLDLWRTLARDVGVAGLLVPESLGGAGASAREAAVVLEELGRAVAPVPFLGSAVLATSALLAAADASAEAASWVRRLAAGEVTAALAVPFSASPYRETGDTVTAGGDGALSGRVAAVAGASVADVLVVPAAGALYVVEAAHAGVEAAPSLDLTRQLATVTLWEAPAVRVAADLAGVRLALTAGAGLLAAEQLGVSDWCLDTTIAYVKERHQFARPVGSFQAIKHRLADLWFDVARARAAARAAADALATAKDVTEDAALPVAVAASWCSDVALHAAEEALQLHAGIGMTWEHPLHLYLKRAKSVQIALGTPGDHRAALAELADLPSPA